MDLSKTFYILLIILSMGACGFVPTNYPLILKNNISNIDTFKGPEIHLLNWNIHKEGNEKEWINDIFNANCIGDPDIFLFQEATLNTGIEYFLTTQKLDWNFVPNAITRDQFTGVLTASKIRSVKELGLISEGKEPITETPKAILITQYQYLTGGISKHLVVANVHGINFNFTQKKFNKQIDSLCRSLELDVGKKAILVAGDFNSWSTSRVTYLNEKMALLGLKEVKIDNATTPPWYMWLLSPFEKLPLDRLYYSSDTLLVTQSKALDCVNSSDHSPLFISFQFR